MIVTLDTDKADSEVGEISPGCIVEVSSPAGRGRVCLLVNCELGWGLALGGSARACGCRYEAEMGLIYAQVDQGDGYWDRATVTVSPCM